MLETWLPLMCLQHSTGTRHSSFPGTIGVGKKAGRAIQVLVWRWLPQMASCLRES
jgi:hypothetical protein